MLVVDNTGSRDVVGYGEFVDLVGLADLPAFDPIDKRRQVFGIAFGSARVGPLKSVSFSAGVRLMALEKWP